MEVPTNSFQFDESPSVAEAKHFEKDVVAQKQEKFNFILVLAHKDKSEPIRYLNMALKNRANRQLTLDQHHLCNFLRPFLILYLFDEI